MAMNMYDKTTSSKPTTMIERLKMEAEQRKKQAAMDKAAAADKAAKAKAAATEDKKRTEFNSRKSGTLPKFAAAKEVARTVRNEAQARAKVVRDESNARTKAESMAKFGSKMDKAAAKAVTVRTSPASVPANTQKSTALKPSASASTKSKTTAPAAKRIVSKDELNAFMKLNDMTNSKEALRDFLNAERGLTRRTETGKKK
jgi:hypothetical protein